MLGFRLHRTVQYQEKGDSIYLIMDYPLKVIILDPMWKRVMGIMRKDKFISFKDIIPLVGHNKPERVEAFLNTLVRKGFLESRGYLYQTEYPFVSVIIPVRNRPEAISDCLESLERIDYPGDKIEVVVVDDASDDMTPEIASQFPVHLVQLKNHRQASFCRNLAVRKARGEVLAFIDSDCIADPLWLTEIIPAFNDPACCAVGGLIDSFYNNKGLDRYEKVKSPLNMGNLPKRSSERDPFFYVPSCNLLVRKNVFLKLGGFKEDLCVGEDVDFCWRFQDQGYDLEYRPLGTVYHKHRNSMGQFCARRFDYGTSEPLLQQFHAKRVKNFVLPISSAVFWSLILFYFATGLISLPGICVIILITECIFKWVNIRKKNIPIHFLNLTIAIFRSYLSLLYHSCAFISRYYLFWSLPFLFLWPLLSVTILAVHLLTGVVEYIVKKPRLNFPYFLLLFTLDQLFYQLGVWWGCLKSFSFGPVNPRIRRNPLPEDLR